MNAPNHWKTALGCWLAGGAAAIVLAGADPLAVAGLAAVAVPASLGPDLDKPPEDGHPGATAAESHWLASNALAEIVSATHRGHRGLTHRYAYAAVLGTLIAGLALRWPAWTAFTLIAWWGAWPLYCSLPRRARWCSAFLAPGTAGIALAAGWLPATPWLGLAVGLGWAAHIACDRLQSGLFEIGGAVERSVAWVTLAVGALAFTWAVQVPALLVQVAT